MNQSTQVLVIGGGPGGSTVATLLAREGAEVTLIERETFPRYHIGESLLPSCLEVFDLLGVREQIEAYGFQRKDGGYFAWGKDSWVLNFNRLHHPYSFQVIRSEFDQLLLDYAKTQGVQVYEGTQVTGLAFEGERPRRAQWARRDGSETGEIAFDYLIDASGRAGLMATRYLKNRQFHGAFQNVALWGYWRDAKRLEVAPPGAITSAAIPEGWIWAIPQHNGLMSVGLVTEKSLFKRKRDELGSLAAVYHAAIAECPTVRDLVQPGTLEGELKTEQDYSYAAGAFTGPGYFIVGDAACFIDPLLSTGVHLATNSALLAAASLASVLRGEVEEDDARAFFEKSYRRTYIRFLVTVSGLYQQYNGKETYFWQAQQLTNHEYDYGDELSDAFLYLTSGLDDLRASTSAQEELAFAGPGQALSPEESEQALTTYNVYNKLTLQTATSSESAAVGLHVVTTPRLGLARNEDEAGQPATVPGVMGHSANIQQTPE